jgi:hypothetical protein
MRLLRSFSRLRRIRTMTGQELQQILRMAFDYTEDNNRDLLNDPTFPMGDVMEELHVQWAYQFLISYIARNEQMIDLNLKEE